VKSGKKFKLQICHRNPTFEGRPTNLDGMEAKVECKAFKMVTKASFFGQCSKMQLIPIKKFII
jgi:hypothetical protein